MIVPNLYTLEYDSRMLQLLEIDHTSPFTCWFSQKSFYKSVSLK